MTEEMDYKKYYLEIANIVSCRFPTCEICTADMVRLLAFENDTLRMALNLPLPQAVINATEVEAE